MSSKEFQCVDAGVIASGLICTTAQASGLTERAIDVHGRLAQCVFISFPSNHKCLLWRRRFFCLALPTVTSAPSRKRVNHSLCRRRSWGNDWTVCDFPLAAPSERYFRLVLAALS